MHQEWGLTGWKDILPLCLIRVPNRKKKCLALFFLKKSECKEIPFLRKECKVIHEFCQCSLKITFIWDHEIILISALINVNCDRMRMWMSFFLVIYRYLNISVVLEEMMRYIPVSLNAQKKSLPCEKHAHSIWKEILTENSTQFHIFPHKKKWSVSMFTKTFFMYL